MNLLPLFPLQLVVFPGEHLNLHIFEPRYKQLIHECAHEGKSFGIPSYIKNKLAETGTEVELIKIAQVYPNGEMDIKTIGKRIFRIKEFFAKAPGKLYSGGEVEYLEMDMAVDPELSQILWKKIQALYQALDIKRSLPENKNTFLTFEVGHHVGLTMEQEFQLLSIPDEQNRQLFLIDHLDNLSPKVENMEEIRKKAQMNGHFKNIIPPTLGA